MACNRLKLSTDSGFSLVEILVAMGISAMLSVAVMQVMKSMSKSSTKLEQNFESMQVARTAAMTLSKEQNCTATIDQAGAISFPTSSTGFELDGIYRDTTSGVTPVFSADTKLSNKLYLHSIQIFGWYDPSSWPTLGAAPTDTFVVPPGSGVSYAGDEMAYGEAVIRVRMNQGSQLIADIDNPSGAQVDFQKNKSLGDIKIDKLVPVRVLYNVTQNRVESCAEDSNQYLAASCNALGGVIEGNFCKNLNIGNTAGSTTDGPALISSGSFYVGDNLTGINRPAGSSDPLPSASGASIGVNVPPPAGAGHIQTEGSIGVGIAPTDGGHLETLGSLGVGVAPPLALPNSSLEVSGGVGIAKSPSQSGSLDVSRALSVGSVNSAGSVGLNPGQGLFEHSVAIGTTAMPGTGQLHVQDAVGIRTNPNSASNVALEVGGRAMINTSSTPDVGGGVNANEAMVVGGNINVLGQNINDENLRHLTTIDWVQNHVAKTLAPQASDVATIMGSILEQDETIAYQATRNAVCGEILIDGKGRVSMPCVFDNIYDLTYSTASNQLILSKNGTEEDRILIDFQGGCDSPGECSQVCINSVCKNSWPTLKTKSTSATRASCVTRTNTCNSDEFVNKVTTNYSMTWKSGYNGGSTRYWQQPSNYNAIRVRCCKARVTLQFLDY